MAFMEASENGNTSDKSQTSDQDGRNLKRSTCRRCGCICTGCTRVYLPKRYLTTFLTAMGMVITYAMRTNLGFTAVIILAEEPSQKVGTPDARWNLPTVKWTTSMVGILHATFYIGYILTHLPGGYLTTVCSSNRLYGGCILFSGAINLLVPTFIEDVGYSATCILRTLQGMSEGIIYPASYGVLRYWSTSEERGRLVSAVLTGCYAGAIIGFPLAGFISHYIGWQYVFYVCGGSCIVWYMFWLCMVYEKPSHHPYISDKELDYIEDSHGSDCIEYENLKTPWREILTSFPVWAICFTTFVRYWIFILMMTNEPYYLSMYGFTVAETGIFGAIPHALKVVCSLFSGYIADILLKDKLFTPTIVRKLLTCTSFGMQALCYWMLTMSYQGDVVMIFLTLGIGSFGLSVAGWQINHYDLSARYAGVLVSITSAFGTIGGILSPIVAGQLTNSREIDGWANVFYITIALLLSSSIFYLIFASGEEQPWSKPPKDIQLIQKADPLARRPYKSVLQQPMHSDKSDKSDDGEKPDYGATRDVNDDIINKAVHRLSRKLDEDDNQ